MPIEVRHSPDVRLTGNVAFLTGQGKAAREDRQQAREAAERRASQERAIQAQFEQMNLQAELQAQRDQESAIRATAMDERNFQQQQEILKQQGLMRANEAEAALDRNLDTIDYQYTAKEKAENDRINERIDWVKNNPRYTDTEKNDLIRQLYGMKKAPTGMPDDIESDIEQHVRPYTLNGVKGVVQRNAHGGWDFKPNESKQMTMKDTAAVYTTIRKALSKKDDEGNDVEPSEEDIYKEFSRIENMHRKIAGQEDSAGLDDASAPIDPNNPEANPNAAQPPGEPQQVTTEQVWTSLSPARQKEITTQAAALRARAERALKVGDLKTFEEVKQQIAELLKTIKG